MSSVQRFKMHYRSADGSTRIHAVAWVPSQKPVAVVQICHGMTEYVGRYEEFARFLAERGFYVTGNDHLGHGASVLTGTDEDLYGYFAEGDGNRCLIKDIHPLRTPKDWLTKDEAVVDRYLADPLCTFLFTLNAYFNMFRGMERMQMPKAMERIPRTLPLFLVSGEEDPVGDYGEGVRKAFEAYKNAGLTDVRMKLYPTDRHELLNETDRRKVFEDLLSWFCEHMGLSHYSLENCRAQPFY